MHYTRAFLKLTLGLCVLSCALVTYAIVSHKQIQLPENLRHIQLTDSQVKLFSDKRTIKPEVGQIVMFGLQNATWAFGVVSKFLHDEYYEISAFDNPSIHKTLPLSSIKTLHFTWNQLFQPTISLEVMRDLLDERIDYYRTHGAPDGHGMILSAHSKIAILGDLHGNFSSLQNHLARMYKDGLIDDQFHLKPDCYVVGLGDYAGDGCQGILVLKTLLTLQKLNPDQVFLLCGDHEDASNAQINGFQKEWYGAFGRTKKEFCLSELVWLKMLMIWKSLPKVLLVGLQMPSTQRYDFLMFCHGSCDMAWRPDAFMSKLVEKHIDQCYKSPCVIGYRDQLCHDSRSFVTGTFVDDADIAKVRAKKPDGQDQKTILSKSVFEQFIKHFASRIDKKYMYQYCLCAIVRGHDHIPGGIVVLKKSNLKTWKPLKNNKVYEIEPCSVYTCTSGSQCMSKAGCFDGAYGLIRAGSNGHWYISSHRE